MLHVLVEISVEAAGDGDVEVFCGAYCGLAEGSFCGDVDDVGRLSLPEFAQCLAAGEAEA